MEIEELRRQLRAGTLGAPPPPPPTLVQNYALKHITDPYTYSHDPIDPELHKQYFRIQLPSPLDGFGTRVSFPVDLNTGRLLGSAYNGQRTIKLVYECPKERITAWVLMVWPCHIPGLVEEDGTVSRKPTPADETCYRIECEVEEIAVRKVRFKAVRECTAGQGSGQFTLEKGQVIEITDDLLAQTVRECLVAKGHVVEYADNWMAVKFNGA